MRKLDYDCARLRRRTKKKAAEQHAETFLKTDEQISYYSSRSRYQENAGEVNARLGTNWNH